MPVVRSGHRTSWINTAIPASLSRAWFRRTALDTTQAAIPPAKRKSNATATKRCRLVPGGQEWGVMVVLLNETNEGRKQRLPEAEKGDRPKERFPALRPEMEGERHDYQELESEEANALA